MTDFIAHMLANVV